MTTGERVTVRVELFADLRQYAPEGASGRQPLELPAGSTMRDIIERFGIPGDYEVTIGRNGEQAHPEDVIAEGDDIVLFSPMEGGAPTSEPAAGKRTGAYSTRRVRHTETWRREQ